MTDIRVRIDGVGFTNQGSTPTVLLREAEGERYLVLTVGRPELFGIVQGLEKIEVPRPTTHDLLVNLMYTCDVTGVSVRIEPWREEVFRATVFGEREGETMALDARPSDAIAMAVRLDLPIYVTASLLRRHGVMEEGGGADEVAIDELDPGSFSDFVM